jgi:hypothetical protein
MNGGMGFGPNGMPMGPDGFPRNGMEGWDNNGGNLDRVSRSKKDKDKDPDEEKQFAMRYGHLPDGLPSWFEEYDLDKDGQVALWEWRKFPGNTIADFKLWDLNDDGVITADEVIRGEKLKVEKEKIAAIENGDKPPPSLKKGQKPVVASADGEPAAKPAGDRPMGDRTTGKGARDATGAPGNSDRPDRGSDRPKGKDGGDGKPTDKGPSRKPPG